ncbi:WD40-like Beta Propeller Repeat protein [Planctomycetes bacterium Poly30]|uniref:WD40-like Beta Propeller Repeat protein n=1 Tax=Saltatorellus ferox TaxID=2528018 RepID=A0A518EW19_9BACT|nr:WD40-like Beta Propeller Repeat protein [Planctomycetes bacterium Poly30]
MIAVSLLAAGFLAAWLRFRPYLGTEGAFTDGERTIEIESVDELRYAVWDDPLPLTGDLNSDEPESAPVLSPDGRYMVFVVGARGLGTDIWVCDLDRSGRALEPRPLIGVNSSADELAPAFTTDGALLFASNRPGGEGGLDIWRSDYDRGVFGKPEHLAGRGLNTPADETDPTAVPGSDAILFASNRLTVEEKAAQAPRQFDLYSAEPLPIRDGAEVVWEVHGLDGINTPYDERDPSLTVDGRALLFASDRGTMSSGLFGFGEAVSSREVPLGLQRSSANRTDTDFDLFRAARRPFDHPGPEFTDEWLPPRPLEGVNTDASERYPRSTPDGFALLFARGDEFTVDESGQRTALPDTEVNWDVWRATSREVVRTPGKPIGWREIIVLLALLLLALLAALAKRWKGMDVIYKAFLVSLLIHLALLFWARDVVPESGPMELREGDPDRVRVRLVEDPNSLRAQRNEERGGRVEAARSEAETSDQLTRAELAAVAAAELAASASMTALQRSEAQMADGPTPMDAPDPEREVEVDQAFQQSIAEAREAFERKTGEAAPLSVAASEVESNRTERTAAEVARDRALAAASANVPVASTEAPSAARLERSSERNAPRDAPSRSSVTVDRSQDAPSSVQQAERTPTMSGPEVDFERKVADARTASDPLALSQSDEARISSRTSSDAPTLRAEAPRAERAPGESVAVAPSATSELRRSERSDPVGGPVALPTAVPTLTESGRATTPVEIALAGPSGEAEIERTEGPAAPAFDALEGAGQAAAALDRSKEPRSELFGPAREVTADSGASSELASASDLAPSVLAPIGRSRSRSAAEAPSFAMPGRASVEQELERSVGPSAGPSAAREVSVADLAGEPTARPSTPASGAEAPSATGSIMADLGPTDTGSLRRRDRSEGPVEGPGRIATNTGSGGAVGFEAPAPAAVELKAPDAPRPPQGVPVAKLSLEQWDRTPYQSRTGERKIAALEEYGGGVETERAVEGGLAYLARRQRSDGRWGRKEIDDKYGQPMVGKTGLACLAFMGAGHTPQSNTEYSDNVAKGLQFLVDSQDPASGHFGNTSSYGHAIATYALGEAFALTSAAQFRGPLVAAVQHIVDNQVSSRDPLLDGGWSYFFADGRTLDRWPRASVTAWQVMALESAKLGGIDVPRPVFARAQQFLVNSWDPSRSAFRYSHDPGRLRSDYPLLPGSTPASMFALSLLGADIGAPQFAPARDFVHARSPRGYRFTGEDDFVYKAQGNLYFWYYGTLAMFRAGGDDWQRWNTALKETLVPAQDPDGSWRPISIYAGYAQDSDGDRSYTTAMNVLTLEVYYRYFTPLLKVE